MGIFKKILIGSGATLLSFFLFTASAFADNPLQMIVSITSDGYVTGICPDTNIYGFGGRKGIYPVAETTYNATSDNVCSFFLAGGGYSIETYLSTAFTGGAGFYWARVTFEGSAFAPDYSGDWYYFTAYYNGAEWSNPSINSITNLDPPYNSTTTAPVIVTADINVDGVNYIGVIFSIVNADTGLSTSTSHYFTGNYSLSELVNFGDGFYSGSISLIKTSSPNVLIDVSAIVAFSVGYTSLSLFVPDDVDFTTCKILTFDLSECISKLVIPDPRTWQSFLSIVRRIPPLGYVTRFGQIASTTPATGFPPISYTFGSSSPSVLQGKTYTIDPFAVQYIGSSSPLAMVRTDDGQNKGVWDVFMPYFNVFMTLVVLYTIYHDIIGSSHQSVATANVKRSK